ncbi:thioredoxin fold domain-containing protein [Idiomarina piscisalsi]|uniref:thioredoxin fold domain-containing protein n=1 Tax=Idiomarina piscisalsi TaxID=1096243 RepID=UPI001383E9F6|nr:thioredoxin fold domain-containing protein [Idiomarina piscisalsi]MTJ02959.1 bifunctional protein-disulfide isomerase/oxidoreductase DsbC [Idiomarina piscisalsi]
MQYLKTLLAVSAMVFSMLSAPVLADKLDTRYLNHKGIEIISTEPGEIDGYVRAVTNQGIFYVSEDGKRLISGSVFDITKPGYENLTEKGNGAVRKEMLADFVDDMIVYKADDEKYKVTVFTDTTCGYCQRLHENLDSYLSAGITVQYLAFPRGGLDSKGGQELQAVWCADDKKAAISAFKDEESYRGNSSCNNPVEAHYALGKSFGVTGTPAIILPDGRLIPGAVPARRLLSELRK